MLNFPKPPKLYYYLAGLVVFIIILSGISFYFYQKQSNPVNIAPTNTTQSSQSSFTSNPEPVKTSDEANIKPKEESLTSASFDADPNTDVIVFEECGISLKVNKMDGLKVYSGKFKDVPDTYKLFVAGANQQDKESSFMNSVISCGKEKFESGTPPIKTTKVPVWLEPYQNYFQFEQIPYNRDNLIGFKFQNLNFTIEVPQINSTKPFLISSIKFDTKNIATTSLIPIFDLNPILNNPAIDYENFQKNFKPVQDIDLIGCNGILRNSLCVLRNDKLEPILDLWTFVDFNGYLENTPFPNKTFWGSIVYKGRKTPNGRYLITKFDNSCVSFMVYDFDFKSGIFNKVKRSADCISTNVEYDQVDNSCFDRLVDRGEIAKQCFKKDSDYQTYLKAYNEEQANNKAAQAELAKYLE